jgi:hypothetical protein
MQQNNTAVYLVKSRQTFEKELTTRIELGEQIHAMSVDTAATLAKLETEYSAWHDFNLELIKRAFNNPNSEYYHSYSYTYSSGIYFDKTNAEHIEETKENVLKHINKLKKLKNKLLLIDESPTLKPTAIEHDEFGLALLDKILINFHKVAQSLRHRHNNAETLLIKNEYDVQDLLRSLLKIHFTDIREEDYAPSYAGGNSRIDFILKDEKIAIETKMTNDNLKDKKLGEELLIDIGRYKSHQDCKTLVVFIYDKDDHVRNNAGIITDLEKMSTPDLKVKIYITPN